MADPTQDLLERVKRQIWLELTDSPSVFQAEFFYELGDWARQEAELLGLTDEDSEEDDE